MAKTGKKAGGKGKPASPAKAPKPPSAPPPGLLTRRVLAAALSVGRDQPYHPMTVTKWEQEGLPVAARGGKGRPSYYRESDVRAWLSVREESAKVTGGLNAHQERARRDNAQAKLAEQMFQMRSLELLPRVEVERQWEAEIIAVRTKLLAVAPTYAERIYQAAISEGVPGVERVTAESMHDVLRELTEVDEAAIA